MTGDRPGRAAASTRLPTALALLIAASYVAVLWRTAPEMGFTRDEGYYFKAAEEYARWWGTVFSRRFLEAFGDAEIKLHFSYNTEHPALVKLTMGVTHYVLHDLLAWAPPSQAYRATGFLFAGLSLVGTFLLGRALVSPAAGLLAMLFLASQPRYFYDAHLACFDVPITALWALCLWGFWEAYSAPPEDPRWRWKSVRAGLLFGVGLATKLNALFLPVVFVFVWLLSMPWRQLRLVRGPSGGRELQLPDIPWVLLSCAVLGPVVFLAHWPWLWHQTVERVGFYIGFHLHHEHYPISYFHTLWVAPPFPWHFSAVMTFFTVPGPPLFLGLAGLLVSVWRALTRRSPGDALLWAATMLPVVLIALPGTPIFGGVKHWYNALPTLSILAARALLSGAEALAERRARPSRGLVAASAALLATLALGPGILGICRGHPNLIGFYNELAGGFRGGQRLGMQRGFWGGISLPLIKELPTRLPQGGAVFFNRTNYDSMRMYAREGVLPGSVYYANDGRAGPVAGLAYEQGGYEEGTGELVVDGPPARIGHVSRQRHVGAALRPGALGRSAP